MSTQVDASPAPPPAARRRALSFQSIGAVYVWLAIIVVFTIWAPATFPTVTTVKQVLNANAITGLVALSLVVPLAARVFDLSVATTMTICGVTVAYLIVKAGLSVAPAVAVGLVLALAIGVVNALVVVVLGVDSFIGTLATGSVLQAFVALISGDASITGLELSQGFAKLGQTPIAGLTPAVYYLVIVALALWFVLEHTGVGRRLYATGFNTEASRLAGIATQRLRFMSLIASALIAGFAGIVLASNLTSGSPTSGTSYLLPAFAAAFLGATQLRGGRFNAWGTVIAVLMLGTGITGLGLAAAPAWAPSMFTGVVLIAALALTGAQRRNVRAGRSPAQP
jgi:ribose transport system permease protein